MILISLGSNLGGILKCGSGDHELVLQSCLRKRAANLCAWLRRTLSERGLRQWTIVCACAQGNRYRAAATAHAGANAGGALAAKAAAAAAAEGRGRSDDDGTLACVTLWLVTTD